MACFLDVIGFVLCSLVQADCEAEQRQRQRTQGLQDASQEPSTARKTEDGHWHSPLYYCVLESSVIAGASLTMDDAVFVFDTESEVATNFALTAWAHSTLALRQ